MDQATGTVLFVDDEAYIRQSFADYFEDRLWETLQADSGEEALRLLDEELPQAAVVDIRMGGMDGNAFIRQALSLTTDMVFIICTGSPEYDIPEDLSENPRISDILFRKPVTDMKQLEEELSGLIDTIGKNRP